MPKVKVGQWIGNISQTTEFEGTFEECLIILDKLQAAAETDDDIEPPEFKELQ